MSEELLINIGLDETRVALIEDGRLVELLLDRTADDGNGSGTGRGGHSILGNIYLGRVQRVLPGMQAAFVEIGLERAGFLGAREARCLCELTGLAEGAVPPISACVQEGQEILVQAVKDPIGEKGTRLSANVTIPGRLLVLVPNQSGVALSRRIEDEEERARLTALVECMVERFEALGVNGDPAGYIVRTAAMHASEAEIAEDARRLAADWATVRASRSQSKPPALIFQDLGPVSRALRDYTGSETDRVLIDQVEAYAEARRYCERAMPEMIDRIQLFNGPDPLFSLFDVEGEIEAALEPRVELPAGGWITIETTEALTAIDVNSGKYTAATGLEETSFRINMEAAHAIVHQLRLRGTGGQIVIDFIHMNDPANIERVLETLAIGFAKDRVPTQIASMSEFGLVEMTRKRVREPLDKLLTEPAYPYGRPRRKTCSTMGNEILRRIEQEARRKPGRAIQVRAAPNVIAWLEKRCDELQPKLGARGIDRVCWQADTAYSRERYDVAVGE